jgi:hypothetical protein
MKPDFQLENLSPEEMDARLAAAATSYGVGTKSYNSSAEKTELKRQQKAVTARYESGPHQEIIVEPRCNCLSFPLAHDLSAHRTLKTEYDWTPWEKRYILDKETNSYVLRVQRWEPRVS